MSFRDVLERLGDAGERRGQTAPVIPEPEAEYADHRCKEHAGGQRRLDGIVTGVGG